MKLFCECGRLAIAHCCWRSRDGEKVILCDKPICEKHSKEPAPGKHLCPEHQLKYESWQKQHPEIYGKKGEQQSLFGTEAA